MAFKSYFNVKLIFIEQMNFGPPQGGGGGLGPALVATWENCILVSKMQYFHWFLKVLQNRACVPAMKKSPKGDFLHNNHHDNVI